MNMYMVSQIEMGRILTVFLVKAKDEETAIDMVTTDYTQETGDNPIGIFVAELLSWNSNMYQIR